MSGERDVISWKLRCLFIPEQPEGQDRKDGEKSREGEAEIEGAGAVREPTEEVLHLACDDPCHDAGHAGDLAMMLARDVLGEGVINGKYPKGACAAQGQDKEKRPAFAEPRHEDACGAKRSTHGEYGDASRVHGEPTLCQPRRDGAGREAANVGGCKPGRVEIERLRFRISTTFLENFREPCPQDLPRGINARDDEEDDQHAPAEQHSAKSGGARSGAEIVADRWWLKVGAF